MFSLVILLNVAIFAGVITNLHPYIALPYD